MMVIRILPLWLAGCLICQAVVDAGSREDGEALRDVHELISQLGAEDYAVRERATRELWSLGKRVKPRLEQLLDSDNPEQAIRARQLLRKIELSITPDSEPELVSLIEAYRDAARAEKTEILEKLRRMRAWRQMLHLYATEKDEVLLQQHAGAAYQVAVHAARAHLRDDRPDLAREMLEMAPVSQRSLIALAEFHRTQGTLERERQRANGRIGAKAAAWRLAIQRVAGNARMARQEALPADEPWVGAVMAALDGDPLPWLQQAILNEANPPDHELTRAYAQIARRQWHGEVLGGSDFKPLARRLERDSSRERGNGRNALMLIGRHELAETSLVKDAPLELFWHYVLFEKIDQALPILGLDPADFLDSAWVERKITEARDDSIEHSRAVSELTAFASFLESRGLHAAALDLYAPPLLKLAGEAPDAFIDLLRNLGGNSVSTSAAPRLVRDIGLRWCGEDNEKWRSVVDAIFGDNEAVGSWLPRMKEWHPGADRRELIDGLLVLFGGMADPDGLRNRWMDRAWQAVDAADPTMREKLLKQISDLAIATGDVNHSIRAWDRMDDTTLQQVYWGQRIVHLSAVGRWREAADLIVDRLKGMPSGASISRPELHAYAAAALRRAGDPEAAAVHDELADKLSLGQTRAATQIANGYSYGGDYKRAAEWFERAILLIDPGSSEFHEVIRAYCGHIRMDPSRIRRTAALEEILCCIMTASSYRWDTPLIFMRQRLQADTARALSLLPDDRQRALELLDQNHAFFRTDGALADFFFPMLRQAGLLDEHDRWFRESWAAMQEVVQAFPLAHNSLNTAAWFAARAQRETANGEALVRRALEIFPNQPAYLDTMAEIQFAMGRRKQALEWSALALRLDPDDSEIRRQHAHFTSDPLPGVE